MKTIKNNAQAYKAPVCKMVPMHVQGLICNSPLYGNSGAAANGYNSDNTTDYEDDF